MGKAVKVPSFTTLNLTVNLPSGGWSNYYYSKYYIEVYKSNLDLNSDSNEIAKDSVTMYPPLRSNHKFVIQNSGNMVLYIKCKKVGNTSSAILRKNIILPQVNEFIFFTEPEDWYCTSGTRCY